jgi:hypothetical protein
MCYQQSYKCIDELRLQFPFGLLYVLQQDVLLPLSTRAQFTTLMAQLYVEAHPYQVVVLPRVVRTLQALPADVVLGSRKTHALPRAPDALINDMYLLECFTRHFFKSELLRLRGKLSGTAGLHQCLPPLQAAVLGLLRAMADRGFFGTASALQVQQSHQAPDCFLTKQPTPSHSIPLHPANSLRHGRTRSVRPCSR